MGATVNGVNGVTLALVPLPGANTIEIADEFHKRLEQIKQNLPEGMELKIGRDRSVLLRIQSMMLLKLYLLQYYWLLSLFSLFFRNIVIALRPLIDIPVSLIGTFFVMYLFGYSINVLTLLGIVLATGLVVDDGIVVTENIFKRIEKGWTNGRLLLKGLKKYSLQ
jgi:multidrug efflux pump subunit AcrB